MIKKIILIILGLLILLIGAFVLLKFKINNTNSVDKTSKSQDSSKELSGRIYFVSNNDDSRQINYYDATKKETQTIFSDKNEDYKLEKIGSFSSLANEYFTYMKNSDSGQMVALKLGDKLEKNVLRENFSKPESIAADPLGKTIYYSNAISTDGTGQHFLYEESRGGKNKRLIYQSKFEILNLQVSSDAKKVIFTQEENKILSIDLDSLKQDEIYKSGAKIYDLTLSSDGNLIFTEGDAKTLNSGIVFTFKPGSKELKKVLTLKDNMPASPLISLDNQTVVAIQKNFKEKYEATQSGDLVYLRVGSDKNNKIGTAIYNIYWLP